MSNTSWRSGHTRAQDNRAFRKSGSGGYSNNDNRSYRSGGLGEYSTNSHDETSGRLVIYVDSSKVGKIIGRGGSKIKALQDESNARINVSSEKHSCILLNMVHVI